MLKIEKKTLTVVCSNVPEDWTRKVKNENVVLFEKAPLEEYEKDQLHRRSSLVFGLQHIDGGANVIEAMEWGLPAIHFRSHKHDGLLLKEKWIFNRCAT